MNNRIGRIRFIRLFLRRFGVFLYILLACFLLLLGISKHPVIAGMRATMADFTTQTVSILYTPFQGLGYASEWLNEMWGMHGQVVRLKEENGKLLYWMNRAQQLSQENERLKKELNFVIPEQGNTLTAYIVASNGGSFARSVLVKAGSKDGVQKGYAALYNAGLLGRIVSVGRFSAQLMLLTDYASRVPVVVGDEKYLGIVAGDNTSLLKLTSLPEGAHIKVGDYVTTSGHAGIYPMGLAVGTVVKVDEDDIFVRPFVAREQVDFVQLVNFGLAGVLPNVEGEDKDVQ